MKGKKARGKPKEYLNLTSPKTGDDIRCKVWKGALKSIFIWIAIF